MRVYTLFMRIYMHVCFVLALWSRYLANVFMSDMKIIFKENRYNSQKKLQIVESLW